MTMLKEQLLLKFSPRSYFSESIRLIKTNISFSSIDKDIKTILITSPLANDGKSFISTNLAVAYAQSNKKVLLIDGDLREGKLHEVFGLRNSNGYSQLILNNKKGSKLELDNYIKSTRIENLSIITRGVTPPNPSELLNSENNNNLLNSLKKHFDVIIIDSTPVLGLSDSIITSKLTDYNILVVSCNKSRSCDIEEAINQFTKSSSKVDGIVLNKIAQRKINDKYYNSKYYYEGK